MVRVVRTSGAVCVENIPVDTAALSSVLTKLVRREITGLPSLSVGREVRAPVYPVVVLAGADELSLSPGLVVERRDPAVTLVSQSVSGERKDSLLVSRFVYQVL